MLLHLSAQRKFLLEISIKNKVFETALKGVGACVFRTICYYLNIMKKDIHPQDYRKVIFHDNASGEQFLMSSTMPSEETAKWSDGKVNRAATQTGQEEYPLVKVEISSASHPFYTGTEKRLDTAGRAEKFKKRMAKAAKK